MALMAGEAEGERDPGRNFFSFTKPGQMPSSSRNSENGREERKSW
jgi:hypothetical protein